MELSSAAIEEFSALSSIYSEEFSRLSSNSFELKFSFPPSIEFRFQIFFPSLYPSNEPPIFDFSSLSIDNFQLFHLNEKLEKLFKSAEGTIFCFEAIEIIREFLTEIAEKRQKIIEKEISPIIQQQISPPVEEKKNFVTASIPEIFTGDSIIDRKSIFIAQFARVKNLAEIEAVKSAIEANPKFAKADHRISAYKISGVSDESGKIFQLRDCDDDGEDRAGGRLLHLIELMGADNIFIIVSRWYGGIHLGTDRFKHINEAARSLMEANGFGRKENKGKTKK